MNDNYIKRYASEDYVAEEVGKLNTAIADLPQADWNQNDETAKDYVKNRPFWTDDPVETVLIAEITNEWTALGFDGALTLAPIEITEGTTYKVNWDGTLYECVSYMTQARIVAVGNDVVGGAGNTGGNGEPFFITVFNGATMVNAGSVGSHTFEVVECVAEVHKINEKYLPDKLMRLTDAEVTFQPCKILDLDSLSLMLFGIGRFLHIENGETHPVPVDVWEKLMDMVSEPLMYPICVMRQPNESYFPVISEVYDDGFEIMSQIISVSNGIFTCKRYRWELKYDTEEQKVSISLQTIDL